MSNSTFTEARAQAGYTQPEARDRCGSCAYRYNHVTENGTKTNLSECHKHWFTVKVAGVCPDYRSKS